MFSTVYACQKNMTSLKCVHLNSVTRFILITILVSIFSQSFNCKPTNSVAIAIFRGNFSEPIDPPITTDKPSRNHDTESLDVKRAVYPPDDQQYQTTGVPLLNISESETVNENNNVSISLTMEPTEIKGTPEMLTLSIAPNMLKRENQQYQTTSVSSLSTSKSETVNGNNNVSINPTTTSASTTRRLYDLKEMDLPTTMSVDTCINCTRLV